MLVVVEDISPEQSPHLFPKNSQSPSHQPLSTSWGWQRFLFPRCDFKASPPANSHWYSHDLQWTLKPADHLRLFSFLAVLGLQVVVFLGGMGPNKNNMKPTKFSIFHAGKATDIEYTYIISKDQWPFLNTFFLLGGCKMQLYSIAEMLENMEMLQHHEGTGTLDVYRLELPPPPRRMPVTTRISFHF